ncbi:MAG: tRNA glutamyl-Q(34) synthetase GluQRS [Candidatus Polarisedimenticolaceae bacterium]|nr:tRNA glutamyl-Q(34) synthetase GluQRS [Candidatus Polarisedimenticolaceae bacterium]
MPSTAPYCGRFAPSPTGALHFGSLIAAVACYLDARTNRGRWLVRMEDIDPPREVPGAADDILHTLEAFGFEWDDAVLYQSRRTAAYQAALEQLQQQGHTYPCGCSRKGIAQQGRPGVEGIIYPGTCRAGLPPEREARTTRLVTPNPPVGFMDKIQGKIEQSIAQEVGDFIIRRSDGLFAYQLAVVVDDAWQGVTHIVRGADLMHSTPRQLYLQRLLSHPAPGYAHLPLAVDAAGNKLSKQTGSLPIDRKTPLPALLAALRFLHQPLPDEQPASLQEFWQWAVANWDIKRAPRQQIQPMPLR